MLRDPHPHGVPADTRTYWFHRLDRRGGVGHRYKAVPRSNHVGKRARGSCSLYKLFDNCRLKAAVCTRLIKVAPRVKN